MSSIKNLEERISKIEERNKRVEADKAWDTSYPRKILIALLTYLIIGFYFAFVLQVPNPWFNAVVPTLGFVLSTLSLEVLKKVWIKNFYRK